MRLMLEQYQIAPDMLPSTLPSDWPEASGRRWRGPALAARAAAYACMYLRHRGVL